MSKVSPVTSEMGHKVTVSSPWALMLPRKKVKDKRYAMSLNAYRNYHHRVNNDAKRHYEGLLGPEVRRLPEFHKIKLTATMYPPSKRRVDIENGTVIHIKYFQDTLVKAKKIPDDDYKHIVSVDLRFGHVDPKNPRVDITIEELKENG